MSFPSSPRCLAGNLLKTCLALALLALITTSAPTSAHAQAEPEPPTHYGTALAALLVGGGLGTAAGAGLAVAADDRPGTQLGDPAVAFVQYMGVGFFGTGLVLVAGAPLFAASWASQEDVPEELRSADMPTPPSPWLLGGGLVVATSGVIAGIGTFLTLRGGDPWDDERGAMIGAGLAGLGVGIPIVIGGLVDQSRLSDWNDQRRRAEAEPPLRVDVAITGAGLPVQGTF